MRQGLTQIQTTVLLFAIIIGVGRYQQETMPPLRYPMNDARHAFRVFTDRRTDPGVVLLIDRHATEAEVKIRRELAKAQAAERFLVENLLAAPRPADSLMALDRSISPNSAVKRSAGSWALARR